MWASPPPDPARHLLESIESDALARLMEGFNKAVYSFSTADKYSTLFLAEFDASMRRMRYVNAGQCPPMLLKAYDGTVQSLTSGGMPVPLSLTPIST